MTHVTAARGEGVDGDGRGVVQRAASRAGVAARAGGRVAAFHSAGVVGDADVHVAVRLAALSGCDDEVAVLGAALAVRAPRLGHVCVDLATIASTATSELEDAVDLAALPWPDPAEWATLSTGPLVRPGGPLRLDGSLLYLDRYWSEERDVAADLLARAELPAAGVDLGRLASGLDALFPPNRAAPDGAWPDGAAPDGAAPDRTAPDGTAPDGAAPDRQCLAAASAVLRRLCVIAGGPGTGKTTTIARVLALLDEQAVAAAGEKPGASAAVRLPVVAIAAPTGKAAARMEEAVHDEAAVMDLDPVVRAHLLGLHGTTLHRLLGRRPDSRTRFRHGRRNQLPHDVVVVDETSMVPLSLMARLLEGVRADARLVLVGDHGQLASVEAGAVLGDIVGPAASGLRMRPSARAALAAATGVDVPAPAVDPPRARPPAAEPVEPGRATGGIGDGIVVLERVHRFGGGIAALADAVRAGDPSAVLDRLAGGANHITWIPVDVTAPSAETDGALGPVRAAAVDAGRRVVEAARVGDALRALAALGGFRVLCAHRRGPAGVATWMGRVERWLADDIGGFGGGPGAWYPGQPLLVTANDYGLRLFNGDTGVVVETPGGRVNAAFMRGGGVVEVSPSRLVSVDTVYAMTVHKAQGSQFGTVAVLLPPPGSPILTRELLYTAVTRARDRVLLVGTAESVAAAVARPVARASGLRQWLWDV